MLKNLKKRISTPIAIGILLILAVLVGGFTIWQYQEMEKETFDQEETIIPEKKKVCSHDNQEYCDKSCESDDDCAFSCYLDCYNKHQEVIFPDPPWPTCGLFSCQCLDGKCEVFDETVNWEIYMNEEYGFEMKYSPELYGDLGTIGSGWWLGIPDLFSAYFSYRPPELVNDDGICVYSVTVTVADNQQELSNQGWLQEYAKNVGYTEGQTEEPEEINISNTTGIKLKKLGGLPPSGGNIDGLVIISKDLKTYLISLNIEQEVLPIDAQTFQSQCLTEGEKTFNQMLSTFRFIEGETTDGVIELSPNTEAIFVYLTDNKYDGKLGGRLEADAKCSPPSDLNCKPETIHAFITVDDSDSIMNMAENYSFNTNLSIYWYNRETNKPIMLAKNYSKMLNEDIINDQEEGTGKGKWPSDFPWTGVDIKGEVGSTCDQWTTNEGNLQTASGPHGNIGGTDKTFWLSSDGWAGISFSTVCANKRYLRCICEGNISE